MRALWLRATLSLLSRYQGGYVVVSRMHGALFFWTGTSHHVDGIVTHVPLDSIWEVKHKENAKV